MPPTNTCPNCGAAIPEEGWQGLCPKCLVNASLAARAEGATPVLYGPDPSETGPERGVPSRGKRGTPIGGIPAQTAVLPQPDVLLERTGMMIGRYKLLQQIGEGGFGVVFMAEQTEPVQRKVALKIIKAGMDTREIIARFEAERQALAMMDHPNIAKVLDAGATAGGRPYFVMELVRGMPLTDYCDQAKLSMRDRLALFIKVCHATQHAHQKGVVHRDLKPGNVLVTLHDGEPVPKVIDFGVAKALGQKLTEKTLFTRFEQMIGTPAYMSPEQAALGGLDIDTRSDIYSLGVLLYELLTGVTPLDQDTLRQGALDEIRRMIRETDPPKPSTRLLTLGERMTEVARCRHTDAASLSRLIRGDLDWITMKALEKDRRRRYETVNGLARDIERHLGDEPIEARPPGNLYRLLKIVRRHKLGFIAGSSILAALVIGFAVSTFYYFKERREHFRAMESEKDTLAAALESFRVALAFARVSGGWYQDWSNSVPALSKLAGGWTRERIRRDLHDRPNLQADLLHFLGHFELYDESAVDALSVSEAGDFAESTWLLRQSLLRESLSLYRQLFGADHPTVAEVLNDLASDPSLTPQEAEGFARDALAIRKKLLDPQGLDVAESLEELGNALSRQTNKAGSAVAAYLQALVIRTNFLRPESIAVASLYGRLAGVQESRGELAAAEQSLHHAAVNRGESFVILYGVSMRLRLAALLRKRGALPEAEKQCREALECAKQCSNEFAGAVAGTLESLALILSEEDKLPEAEARFKEFLTVFEPKHPRNWRTFDAQSRLGGVLLCEMKYADAEPLLLAGYEGLRRNEQKLPTPVINLRVEESLQHLVELYETTGRPDQAAEWKKKLGQITKTISSESVR